jgi:hypothetical protein
MFGHRQAIGDDGPVYLRGDETLANFIKQSTQQRGKRRNKERERERERERKPKSKPEELLI